MTVLYSTVLYCTVLHCTVLYCTVLYCKLCEFSELHYTQLWAQCSLSASLRLLLLRTSGEHVPDEGKERKIQKEASGGSLRMCGGGCGKEGLKRCTGCYLVHYCGTDCQRTAWSSHCNQCQESRAQYKIVRLVTQEDGVYHNYKSRNVSVGNIKKQKPSKNHFVVKCHIKLKVFLFCQFSVISYPF